MKKRGLSLFLALALCLTLLPTTAWAEGTDTTADVWDGTSVNTDWYANAEDGTTEFTITTAAQLAGLASLVNSGNTFSGKTITLGSEIDLKSQSWTPIGTSSNSFSGTFDGSGNTISHLTVNTTSDHAGLFGCVNGGTVKNLNVEGTVTVESTYPFAGGVVGYTNATVENCSFSGEVTGTATEILCIGGVVGRADATVESCSFSGTVTGTSYLFAGGVVGCAYTNSTVKNCYNTGNVSGNGNVGGVVGYAYTNSTVKNCYNTGDVLGSGNAGGVVGCAYDESTVGNCYNTGDVSGSGRAGGVVGYADGNADLPSHAVYVEQCYFLQDENTNKDLSGVGASNGRVESGSMEAKTATEFASGEVAWLLRNNNFGDDNPPWRQNLGGADNSPVLDSTHAQVVKLDNGSYANAPKTDETGAYLIYTADDLVAFAALVNSSSSSIDAKLMKDIDLSSVCGESVGKGGAAVSWTPIGNTSSNPNVYFQGTFDGQGHTVSGLYMNITRTDKYVTYGGLFGDMRGAVKNLNVSGTVTVTNNNSDLVYVGGVVGEADKATVENCSFAGKVTGTGNSVYVGGVVGTVKEGTTVKNCYHTGAVTGTVTGTGGGYVGGVAGRAHSGTTVENCYFLQDTGTNTSLHGIGYNTTSTGASDTGAEPKTADAFASGEVAWLLNGGENQDENSPWYQNLTGDDADDSPVLDSTHARVVKLGDAYVNASTGDDGKTYYLIYTAEQLQGFASAVNGGSTTINAKLMDDIDLADITWTPIVNYSNGYNPAFQGTFDGQGHTVSGLYVSVISNNSSGTDTVYVGLFGRVGSGGVVQNVNVVDGNVTGTGYGPIAGGVVACNEGGTVQYCFFSGTVQAIEKGSTPPYAGGVVGYNRGGTVRYCYNTGAVTATASPYGRYAGGVVGSNYNGTVQYCYNTGKVQGSPAGGIVGAHYGTVSNCYFLQDGDINSGLNAIGDGSGTNVESKTAEAFASGEVAYLLQSGQEGTVWVQAKNADETWYPALTALLSDSDTYYTVYRVTFTAGENTTYKYTNSEGHVTLPDDPDMGTGNALAGWYDSEGNEFTAETNVTADLNVTAKARPNISIDYKNETLTGFVSGATYTITIDGTEVTLGENNTLSVTDYMGKTVSIVRKLDDSANSEATSLTIPARPAAPTGLQGENETVDGNHDGKITGVTTAMEYKLSTAESWTKCTGTEVTGLAPGSYQIRLAATNSAFASAAANVTIATGAARTYTLNVTAPTFDSAVYGYAQPAAQAITISNSGNSASTISGVALSGNTSAFTLNKTDGATVQPGQSDTSYTIQPAAGLGAGTYTATITVTYQDGETATATVSFTVTQAAQEAPAAPELDSQTTNSITLKEITANENGAAVQYGISTDGGKTWTWQASPAFTKLSSGKEYTFAVRYGATTDGNYAASPASVTAAFSTTWPSSPAPTYTPTVEDADNGTVSVTPASPKQGGTVTITPTPDKGYETASVTVTDSKGNPVTVTDNGDGTYSFTQPASKVTISVTYACDGRTDNCPSYHFGDVDTTKWYHEAVDYMVTHGLMTGTAPDTFSPNSTTTRAMVVTILYRLEGEPSTSGSTAFTDVERGAWYTDPIAWAAANGVVDGTSPTTFAPNSPVTREQMATILYRYLAAKGYDVTARADLSAYTDADQISSYATDAMSWANALGLITGETPTTLVPQGNATRAQVATILMRFCETVARP